MFENSVGDNLIFLQIAYFYGNLFLIHFVEYVYNILDGRFLLFKGNCQLISVNICCRDDVSAHVNLLKDLVLINSR